MSKILLPNDVRKILNADNKEIIALCKKTSITPKRDRLGQVYFSVDEVKKLKQAKSDLTSNTGKIGGRKVLESIIKKNCVEKNMTLPEVNKNNSQVIVNNLLDTLNEMENNITTSMTKVLDEKLEGMDDVVLELVRCKTENENLKNKINDLNKENFKLRNLINSFKPLALGFYIKKEENNFTL